MVAGEKPGMTLHLNLLAEQAEEAIAQNDGMRAQNEVLAVQLKEVPPKAFRSFLARILKRQHR